MKASILIVEARFYEDISNLLFEGVKQELEKYETSFECITVPGALEIPAAIAFAKDKYRYDGYIALGCVIRGETSHYDVVASESARGLQQLAIQNKLAIGNGILTVENKDQAIKRADPKGKNKGGIAANACLTMIRLKTKLI